MNQKSRNFIMWSLFGLLFVLVMLVQTTVFGRVRLLGVKVSLLPMVMVCVGLQTGHEKGGLFCLLAALFWYAAGGDNGSLAMITFTLCGILSGWLCDVVFPRRFFPALILCFAALMFHETAVFLTKFYLGNAPISLLWWVPATAVLSLPAVPVVYLLSKLIRKAGAAA